jgi:hypothetical protein
MAVPLLLSKDRVSGNGHAVVQVVAVVVALLVVAAVLALGTPPMQRAASEPRAAAASVGPATRAAPVAREGATAELTRINHLLEARQAELGLSAGSSRRSLAVLRAQIASLERQYAAAITAVTRAR